MTARKNDNLVRPLKLFLTAYFGDFGIEGKTVVQTSSNYRRKARKESTHIKRGKGIVELCSLEKEETRYKEEIFLTKFSSGQIFGGTGFFSRQRLQDKKGEWERQVRLRRAQGHTYEPDCIHR